MPLPHVHKVARRSMGRSINPIALSDGEGLSDGGNLSALPPTEFLVFRAGANQTRKGLFYFDRDSQDFVMASYRAGGVDLMIDYDHASVDGLKLDPALSGKAAGWCSLEVRGDELWAVNVRWTQPAAEAIARKEWRYTSPTFFTDSNGRIVEVLNIAITNMPATMDLPPLVAASKGYAMGEDRETMTALADGLAVLQGIIAALTDGDVAGALQIAKEAASTVEAAPTDDGADSSATMKAASEAPAPTGGDKDSENMKAAGRLAMSLTGLENPGLAMAELARRSQVALSLKAREEKLAQAQAALEMSERKGLVAKLISLGVEIPATAWDRKDSSKPCARLMAEPIDEMRARVESLSAAKGGTKKGTPQPPTTASKGGRVVETPKGPVELSEREIFYLSQKKASEEDIKSYATRKAGLK